MEKRLFLQKNICDKVTGEDLANLIKNNFKEDGSNANEQGSLFDNINMLEDIDVVSYRYTCLSQQADLQRGWVFRGFHWVKA